MTFTPTLIDGYKTAHRVQYPIGTTRIYSNFTPRGTRSDQKEVVFFGLQYFLEHYLNEEWQTGFFDKNVDEVCDRYQRRMDGYLGEGNGVGTEHIRALHNLGYLPLKFRALKEGSAVPIRVPMLTIENTHDDFAWLTNYFETLLSNILWMPCTSATTAFRSRKILDKWAKATGGDPEFVNWQGHDFSMRGMAGIEAAQMSGAGHLLSFTGTDTIPAIDFLEDFYFAHDTFVGGSVPATEHSVMCASGDENEEQTFQRLLNKYPTGPLAIVSDTWNLWNVITNILVKLKDQINARDGKLVIRPDSGDPADILCGDPNAPVGSPAHKGVVEGLWDIFGGTFTETGHKLLDSHIGTIYGDSINDVRMEDICQRLADKGFASTNVVFGVGSFSYQYVTRDTYMFAVKATAVTINGEERAIFKDPITDNGIKKSLRGRVVVLNDAATGEAPRYRVEDGLTEAQVASVFANELELVWQDGFFSRLQTLDEVRAQLREFAPELQSA